MEIAAQNNFGVENGPSGNFLLERHLVECEKNAELRFLNRSLRKQVCSQNCASGVMHWICENKLGWDSLCSIQIERICFVEAGKKENVETVVECKRMWQIYEECGVLDLLDHYAFPDETNAKLEMINEAWNKIMTSNEEVLVLGKTNPKADGGGHLVVCDLKTKTEDGYEICDPQIDKSEFVSREKFTAEIVSVDTIENLIIFKVNIKKLEQIIDKHRDVLHFPDHNRSTMLPEPLATTSVLESVQNSRIVTGDVFLSNSFEKYMQKISALCSPVILKTILVILNLLVFVIPVCLFFPTVKKCEEPLDFQCMLKRQNVLFEHIASYHIFRIHSFFYFMVGFCYIIVRSVVIGVIRFICFKFSVVPAVFYAATGAVVYTCTVVTAPVVAVLAESLISGTEFSLAYAGIIFSERLRVLTFILVVFLAVIIVIPFVVPSVHVAKIVFIVVFTVIVVVFIIANFVPSVWPIAVGIAGAAAFIIIVVTIFPASRISSFLLFHIFLLSFVVVVIICHILVFLVFLALRCAFLSVVWHLLLLL